MVWRRVSKDLLNWHPSDIATEPPSHEMAAGDREPLGFDAEEAVTAASATALDITDAAHPVDASSTVIEGVNPTANGCTVTVIGGPRGSVYELSVQFTNAVGRIWTRTLILLIVAD